MDEVFGKDNVESRDRGEDRKPIDGLVLAGRGLARTHVDGLALRPRPDDYPPVVEPETLPTRRSHGCTLDDDQPCPVGGPPTLGHPNHQRHDRVFRAVGGTHKGHQCQEIPIARWAALGDENGGAHVAR